MTRGSMFSIYRDDFATACRLLASAFPGMSGSSVVDVVRGRSRVQEHAYPRQVMAWWLRAQTELSYPAIGKLLGGRHHATVMFGERAVDREIRAGKGPRLRLLLRMIEAATEAGTHDNPRRGAAFTY